MIKIQIPFSLPYIVLCSIVTSKFYLALQWNDIQLNTAQHYYQIKLDEISGAFATSFAYVFGWGVHQTVVTA